MNDKYVGGTLNPQFNKEAASEQTLKRSQEGIAGNTVPDTASQEMYLRDRFSEEHDAIDDKYREETAKLSGAPINTPSLGLGSDDPDTIHQKYEDMTTQWSRDRERLAEFEDYSTDRVRSEGTTLSNEFEASSTQIGMPHETEIANDEVAPEQASPQFEFERSANSKGHTL